LDRLRQFGRFRSGGTSTVATFLDNTGVLRVDRKGRAGGTILNIGGTLTKSGSLRIGHATLSAQDTVMAASLDNTGGEIRLLGSVTNQALLDVTGKVRIGTTRTTGARPAYRAQARTSQKPRPKTRRPCRRAGSIATELRQYPPPARPEPEPARPPAAP
jgi:hypothetical protein